MLSAGFALGVVLLSAQAGFTQDLTAYIVGSILTVTGRPTWSSPRWSLAVVLSCWRAAARSCCSARSTATGWSRAGYPASGASTWLLLLVEAPW